MPSSYFRFLFVDIPKGSHNSSISYDDYYLVSFPLAVYQDTGIETRFFHLMQWKSVPVTTKEYVEIRKATAYSHGFGYCKFLLLLKFSKYLDLFEEIKVIG